MNKDNLTKLFENYDNRTDEYVGVEFYLIYNEPSSHYRIYIDNDGELKYINGYEYFGNIHKNQKNQIDTRELIRLLKETSGLTTICISEYTYLVVGEEIPFTFNVILGSESDIVDSDIDIFCKPEDIENIMSMIKHCFVVSKRKEKIDFGIATFNGSSIYTSYYDYEPKIVDINQNYNDDFKQPYQKILNIIEQKNETGLILLYGEPGTGKSTIIKNLITKYPEIDFVFVDGSLLSSASQNTLISYFVENQNTVFILEDCEKVLMSREEGFNPIINTLLNITDGIIGDVLGIKLICTFNTSLSNIDKALLRKGRLSLKYEFKKLEKKKVSKILGKEVNEDMILADIYNIDDENDFSKKEQKKVGFNI